MKRCVLAIAIAFLFSGCCISLLDDACVIEVAVPGPTKVVYEKCKLGNLPDKPPAYGESVSFVEISFDEHIYYGIPKDEAIDLSVNILNKEEYCSKLESIVTRYADNNESQK